MVEKKTLIPITRAPLEVSSAWGAPGPAEHSLLSARRVSSHAASPLLTREAQPGKSAGLPPQRHRYSVMA